MPTPRSEVLKALERENLWELDADGFYGWVIVCRLGHARPRALPWTFGCRKTEVYDGLLRYGRDSNLSEVPWAEGFPVDGSRMAQLRSLGKKGY